MNLNNKVLNNYTDTQIEIWLNLKYQYSEKLAYFYLLRKSFNRLSLFYPALIAVGVGMTMTALLRDGLKK